MTNEKNDTTQDNMMYCGNGHNRLKSGISANCGSIINV